MNDVETTPRKNKINIVPSDKNLTQIMENTKLYPPMRNEFCELHTENPNLKNFLEKEMEIVDKVVKEFLISGNSFDFSWGEYTLRDIVIKEFDDFFAFSQNLKMLGMDDEETMDDLKDILKIPNGRFMTVLLYYGAPSDTDNILSGIRFIDIIGATECDELIRNSFLRYRREL